MLAMLPGITSSALMFILIKLVGVELNGSSDIERLLILIPVGVAAYMVTMLTVWRSATRKVLDIVGQLLHRLPRELS
jgi:hypothetical protein